MSKHPFICDADDTISGEMICHKCGKEITQGLYLNIYYAVSHRGNEDDYTRQWHQECSADHPQWKKYFEELQKYQIFVEKKLAEARKKAIEYLNSSSSIDIEEVDGAEWYSRRSKSCSIDNCSAYLVSISGILNFHKHHFLSRDNRETFKKILKKDVILKFMEDLYNSIIKSSTSDGG